MPAGVGVAQFVCMLQAGGGIGPGQRGPDGRRRVTSQGARDKKPEAYQNNNAPTDYPSSLPGRPALN